MEKKIQPETHDCEDTLTAGAGVRGGLRGRELDRQEGNINLFWTCRSGLLGPRSKGRSYFNPDVVQTPDQICSHSQRSTY